MCPRRLQAKRGGDKLGNLIRSGRGYPSQPRARSSRIKNVSNSDRRRGWRQKWGTSPFGWSSALTSFNMWKTQLHYFWPMQLTTTLRAFPSELGHPEGSRPRWENTLIIASGNTRQTIITCKIQQVGCTQVGQSINLGTFSLLIHGSNLEWFLLNQPRFELSMAGFILQIN